MAISSTINLPSADTHSIQPKDFAHVLATYASRLRGFTAYPDGARGGQPLTVVDYNDAVEKLGEEFEENLEFNDSCTMEGVCGV
jgi:ribonucleoside-diphosphate reductase alpha chain